jgi:hypothetical protein
MAEEKMTEQESLQIITEMIQNAKASFHETGVSAILWGSVVGLAGLISFAEKQWNFYIGFDIWLIVLAAIIPQVFISIREARRRKATSHQEAFMDAVWLVYGISIFALLFYVNTIPGETVCLLDMEGKQLMMRTETSARSQIDTVRPFVPSFNSLLIILYAIPTLVTGIACKFRPMLIGGICCYVFFVASCYTPNTFDYLLNGIAGIINWLIPGLILYNRHLKGKRLNV